MATANSNPNPEVFTTHYERTDEQSLPVTIVRAVGAVTGDDPETITPPLYDVVDLEKLETAAEAASVRSDEESNREYSFEFHHCRVTVYQSGLIQLRPLATALESSPAKLRD